MREGRGRLCSLGSFHARLEGTQSYQNVGSLIRHFLLGFHGSRCQELLKGAQLALQSILDAQPVPPAGGDVAEAEEESLALSRPAQWQSQIQASCLQTLWV